MILLAFNVFFLLISSGNMEECVTFFTGDEGASLEKAQDDCEFFMGLKDKRGIVLGVSGAIMAVCVIILFLRLD